MSRPNRLAIVLALLTVATPLTAQRSARRVIDAAEIAAAGWHRLGEMVEALPAGSTASVDGFNHELTGSRLGFFQTSGTRASWVVRVDGQSVPMRTGGLWMLDLQPIVLAQVDSIVIVEGPVLTDGRAATVGAIDFFTRRPPPGPAVVADYQHGNESGDPGPYRYTSRTRPNVEKIGPFTSGAVSYGAGRISIDVAARYASMNTTDERIHNRLDPTVGPVQQDVNASGGSGVASMRAFGGHHFLVISQGRTTGLMDFPRDPGLQPTRVVAAHAGLSGSLSAGRARYALSRTSLEQQPIGQSGASDTPTREMWDGLLETQVFSMLRLGIAGTFGRSDLASEMREEYTTRGWASAERSGWAMQAAVERADDRIGLSGSTRYQWTTRDSDVVSVSLTALDAWQGSEFEWMEGGLAGRDRMRTIEARADATTRPLGALVPTWYGRVFRHVGMTSNERTAGLAGGVVATTPIGSRVRARFRAEASQVLGDAEGSEQSTPVGFIDAAAATRVAGGFAIAMSGRYAPRTTWPVASPGNPIGEVPAVRRIDFSVNKAMWRDRVRAQLVVRNLLDQPDRTHPAGAQWNLRTHLAVTVALPSGASR